MWHKRQRDEDPTAPPGKRLRDNLVDLYASGEVAGARAQSLLDDASDFARSMGSGDMQELRDSGSAGAAKNRSRDLRRRLLRRSAWPPIYIQEVRCYSKKLKEMVVQRLAFLLPHEIIAAMSAVGKTEVLCQHQALDAWNKEKHREILERMGCPFVSVSLWGDGVPFSWDRKRSADIWTISFPGLLDKTYRDIRICITSMPHEWVTRETQDDVMSVLSWSFSSLAAGVYPSVRADGAMWSDTDSWRSRKAGQALQHAALIEVKGDWKQLFQVFGVPSWMRAPAKPICWRCNASKASLKLESGPTSSWMRPENRLSQQDGILRIREEGDLSPAFSIPWFSLKSLRMDWLHVADQGITPAYLGGLFDMILTDPTYGRNEEERCKGLWAEIQAFYEAVLRGLNCMEI